MNIRAFIAIILSDPLKHAIEETVTSLRKTGADIKWVKSANLHVTLKFLGNITKEQAEAIALSLKTIAGNHESFAFSLKSLGVFPDERRPRVVWVGIKDHLHFMRIAKEIEDTLRKKGFAREKRSFKPHITIGRARSGRGIDKLITELVKYRGTDFGSQYVEAVHLMKSTLKPGGAEYESMYTVPLRRMS